MSKGLDNLKHIVVLMMENRSFDHMLGALKETNPRVNGLTGNETNPDPNDKPVPVLPKAEYQNQLNKNPDHHFPGTDPQIFGGQQGSGRVANMQGFVKSYFTQTNNAANHVLLHARQIAGPYHASPRIRAL
jgi:phospholipase C